MYLVFSDSRHKSKCHMGIHVLWCPQWSSYRTIHVCTCLKMQSWTSFSKTWKNWKKTVFCRMPRILWNKNWSNLLEFEIRALQKFVFQNRFFCLFNLGCSRSIMKQIFWILFFWLLLEDAGIFLYTTMACLI